MRDFTLIEEGNLTPIKYVYDYAFADATKDYEIDLSDVVIRPVNTGHSLLIKTQTDSFEVVSQKTLDALMHDFGSLPKNVQAYYSGKFPPNNEALMERLRDYYSELKSERSEKSSLAFTIIPTYSCNLDCAYCFQKGIEGLDKRQISPESLDRVLKFIDSKIHEVFQKKGPRPVTLEVFGGEPMQPKNEPILRKIFEFAKTRKIFINITTNGAELNVLSALIAEFRDTIIKVFVNLDSDPDTQSTRMPHASGKNVYYNVVANINYILSLDIQVTVGINLDGNNVEEFPTFLGIAKSNNWWNNDLVEIKIGRVEDRLYRDVYSNIDEADLLIRLIEFSKTMEFPKNIKLGFIKTLLYAADKIGKKWNQNEAGRMFFHYCWTTSPVDDVYYLDSLGDVYRCIYSVGRKAFRVGAVGDEKLDYSRFHGRNFFEDATCLKCEIGTYCGGGCVMSVASDRERFCKTQKELFWKFVDRAVVPFVSERLEYQSK